MNNKKKILIVEDEKNIQEVIRMMFEEKGYSVLASEDIESATQTLNENKDTSVIWLDHYLLGDRTGLDFVSYLKNSEDHNKIPIYVVSNTAGPEKKAVYLKLGVEKFFTKTQSGLESIVDEIVETV